MNIEMCESDFLTWISSLVRNVWIIVANDGDFFSFLNQFYKSLLVFHEGYMFKGPQKTIEKIFENRVQCKYWILQRNLRKWLNVNKFCKTKGVSITLKHILIKLNIQIDLKTYFKMWWKWLASGNFKLDYVCNHELHGVA